MLSPTTVRIPSTFLTDSLSALQPLNDSSLNARSASEAPSRKRKHSHVKEEPSLGGPFIVHPHTSSQTDKPLKLTPRLLVPRSCVPLAFIDGITSPRLFRANIGALETTASEWQSQDGAQVVIAEQEDKCTLYVVEEVNHRIYTLCKLCDWVALDEFESGPRILKRSSSRYRRREDYMVDGWWKTAAVGLGHGKQQRRQKTRESEEHTEIRLSMKPPSYIAFKPEILEEQTLVESVKAPKETQCVQTNLLAVPQNAGNNHLMTLGDVQGLIRTQYLESLYISKTSLAYFAKGPLSRARASINQFPKSEISLTELTESLRSIILSRAMTETKYSHVLPNLLRELPAGIDPDDEDGHVMNILGDRLRKSKKRKRVAKSGLFPGEEEYVTRWHFSVEKTLVAAGPDASRQSRIRSSLIEQRARETQLQIILILEALALEASAENTVLQNEPDSIPNKGQGKVRSKNKKSHDLSALIEMLVERLCIWQSTRQEEGNMVRDSAHGNSDDASKQNFSASNNDQLRGFCTEVVIPFYATRLPELSSSICQKLGGPSGSSPDCSSLSKTSNPPRPGTAIQRRQRKRNSRTLERGLTDEKTSARRAPPTLLRSTTDSVIPRIKRELSEISLSATFSSKPYHSIPQRYIQREVDLTAASQATKAKLQKKAAVEQELKDAIAISKKPNSRLAVKELVDSTEKRIAGSLTKSRKSQNPIRNPFGQGVQVMATPKGNRRKNAFGHLPRLPAAPAEESREPEMIPPSSNPRVPSSSVRPGLLSDKSNKSTAKRFSWPVPTIEQTPSRKTTRVDKTSLCNAIEGGQDMDELSQAFPELPIFASRPSSIRPLASSRKPSYTLPPSPGLVQGTPSRELAMTRNHTQPGSNIQGTPVKGRKASIVEKLVDDTLRISQTPDKAVVLGTQQSIYESLGWDDNDVDELL